MPSPPDDPDDAPSAEDEDLTVGEARARAAVIQALREAFPARRPRRFDPFVNSRRDGEPAEVEDVFGPVGDWTAIDVERLDQEYYLVSSALAFLSDEALCFYLPAFLIAGLMGQCMMGPPNFWLTHPFEASAREKRYHSGEIYEADGRRRFSALTLPQVRAVIGYLEWWLQLNGAAFETEIVEALDRYWRPRALAGAADAAES